MCECSHCQEAKIQAEMLRGYDPMRSAFRVDALREFEFPFGGSVPRGLFDRPVRPSIPTPQDHLVAQLRKLHSEGHDLSSVTATIDQLEAEKKQRLEKALDGVIDLAKMAKPKARRFILAYHNKDGETKTVEGVEHGDTSRVKDEDAHNEYRVHVKDSSYVIGANHPTMKTLRKRLDDKVNAYRIAYLD